MLKFVILIVVIGGSYALPKIAMIDASASELKEHNRNDKMNTKASYSRAAINAKADQDVIKFNRDYHQILAKQRSKEGEGYFNSNGKDIKNDKDIEFEDRFIMETNFNCRHRYCDFKIIRITYCCD